METNRTLVAVDLENLVGGANPSNELLERAVSMIETLRDPSNQVVVAASHRLAVRAAWRLPWARWRWRSGPDGADLALVDVLEHERVGQRFTEVVVVSGDGIFSEPVASLGAAGVHTVVVASPCQLSKRLRLAAHVVLDVDLLEVFHDAA
jgi:hypothetical protein